MNIERIDGDTRMNYAIHIRLDGHSVVLQPSGMTISQRSTPRSHWRTVTNIYRDNRSRTGYKAYDSHGGQGAPVNHREYQLTIPDEVRAEALASVTIEWKDYPNA